MPDKKKFQHQDIHLPNPAWGSDLAGKIIELEKLRERKFVPYNIDLFWELKTLFQQLENWASAHIEGNQTKLIDALDPDVRPEVSTTTGYKELENLRDAINFIDEFCKENDAITEAFILEIHKRVTQNLPVGMNQPGDETPGKFRTKDVEITESPHLPPLGVKVKDYMEEFVKFTNENHPKQYYLLKAAILHHRFTWVHPFTNGNGRVTRLLTYAMLQIMGYGVTKWRISNPTAIFYSDRKRYYQSLSHSDNGSEEGLLAWSDYFIGGLIEETNKIDRLLDGKYVLKNLLIPILKDALDSGRIGDQEYRILRGSVETSEMTFVSADINSFLDSELTSLTRSRIIKSMRTSGLITTALGAKQKYVIQLWSPILIRHVTKFLEAEGFVHDSNE